jgi:predicted metal-dependent hydrolase
MDPASLIDDRYRGGLADVERGAYFAAHEAFEEAWRAAPADERDFFQGLVHVAVAWYQAGRSNEVGCLRQLDKALRRLAPYGERHRDLDLADLRRQLEAARASYPNLPRPSLRLTGAGSRTDASRDPGSRAPG